MLRSLIFPDENLQLITYKSFNNSILRILLIFTKSNKVRVTYGKVRHRDKVRHLIFHR